MKEKSYISSSTKNEIKLWFYEFRRFLYRILIGWWYKPNNRLKHKTKQTIFVWTMLAIPLAHFLLFYVYVNFNSIMLAFKNIDFANGGKEYWTFDNFKEIFRMFKEGGKGVNMSLYAKNTLKFWALNVFWTLPWSLVLTYVFHKKLRNYKFFRIMLFIPSLICGVVGSTVFSSFIAPNGVFGRILTDVFNVSRVPNWFMEEETAMGALLFHSWFFSFTGSYIIFSGAMARIPQEIQEAALLDGAGMWREIWNIYIPLMWPTLSLSILGIFTGIFGASGAILLFTPNMESTFTLGYWIYDQVRVYNSYYLPAALGLLFTLIAFPISLFIRWLVTRIWYDVEM